ncbi:MAG: YhbY family RNA-binding protein [Casimicrobiaceae bacterium]
MKPLIPAERRALRAKAHHLEPVVIVGQHGLTPAVLHEIDLALAKHELVKVRVFSDDRDARDAMLAAICTAMDCAPVQHVGKVLVLWRLNPEKKKKAAAPKDEGPARKSGTTRRTGKKAGPRTPVDPVRERRRTVLVDGIGQQSGKGRRGAARNAPVSDDPVEAIPEKPAARRKSSYTPRTTPKSFSAKPNPRSAWEKKKSPAEAAARPRRRKTGG